jgi:hypothetical protein
VVLAFTSRLTSSSCSASDPRSSTWAGPETGAKNTFIEISGAAFEKPFGQAAFDAKQVAAIEVSVQAIGGA